MSERHRLKKQAYAPIKYSEEAEDKFEFIFIERVKLVSRIVLNWGRTECCTSNESSTTLDHVSIGHEVFFSLILRSGTLKLVIIQEISHGESALLEILLWKLRR